MIGVCDIGHVTGEKGIVVGKQAGSGKVRKSVSGLVAAALIAAAPTAGWALTGLAGDAAPRIGSLQLGESVFTPSAVDPAVADLVAQRGGGRGLDRFTPAGSGTRAARRIVTVAVRVDGDGATRFTTIRPGQRSLSGDQVADAGALRIAPTRYNLGVARGFQPFAKPAPVLSQTLSDAAIPNLAEFRPAEAKPVESRFATRIGVEENGRGAPAARPADPIGDQTVNVAGSYRLTRNLNVTAGVRYSQQQHRITQAQDVSHKEGQAVYIGTQFSF